MRGHEFQRVGQVGRKGSHAALPVSDTVAPAAPIQHVVGGREDRRLRVLVGLAVILLLIAGGFAALPGLASGAPFQRGDVFITGGGGTNEYSPSGQLQQMIAAPGAAEGCFDPSGRHLILPGAGLIDSSGSALPSNWGSVSAGGCAADGFGHVYVTDPNRETDGIAFSQYDLRGDLLHSYAVFLREPGTSPVATLDIAPDECTIYYGPGFGMEIERFDVCTNTQQSPLVPWVDAPNWLTQLRVLDDWQVLIAREDEGSLISASGDWKFVYTFGDSWPYTVTTIAPNPDGTSFWMGYHWNPVSHPTWTIGRFDINSGQMLTEWQPSNGQGYLAVYGPPLLGDANVAGTVDSNTAGTAEAFVTPARFSGQMSRLHLYVDSSSTASQVVVGIYANRNGHPGTLQKQATISNVRAGSWNYVQVPVPSMPVTAGQRYWIAVLGPKGGGTIRFRDAASGPGSETSSQHNLTALPATWSTGKTWATGNLSAYGS